MLGFDVTVSNENLKTCLDDTIFSDQLMLSSMNFKCDVNFHAKRKSFNILFNQKRNHESIGRLRGAVHQEKIYISFGEKYYALLLRDDKLDIKELFLFIYETLVMRKFLTFIVCCSGTQEGSPLPPPSPHSNLALIIGPEI